MDNYLTTNLKNMLELLKEGKTITVAEKIKRLALFLDYNGYGKLIKELKSECYTTHQTMDSKKETERD